MRRSDCLKMERQRHTGRAMDEDIVRFWYENRKVCGHEEVT